MLKGSILAVALAAALPALAQSGTTYPQPAQQQPQGGQPAAQPQQPQGTDSGTSASPGSGAASQQVVVNPPPAQGTGSTQQPPSSTTVVTPPPAGADADVDVVVEREERNPMATVAMDAAYGGIAGLLVGVGVALVNEWDNWDRDIMIGAGSGLIIGAAVGVAHAAYDARESRRRRDRYAFDGLGSTARDPVISARPVIGLSGRF
jgi:hypothetical protein